jgi:hypothetical protein
MSTMKFSAAFSDLARPLAACMLCTLVGCGGGGGDDAPGGVGISRQVAQTASENVVIPSDSAQAMSVTMSAARVIVGAGLASVTIPCSGGGSADYQISGPPAGWGNGRFDTGEGYSIRFSNCRNSSDGSVVNGSLGFTVNAVSGEDYSVTATHDVQVQLPQRTTRLNGSSTFVHAEFVASGGKTTTDRWTAGSISVQTTKGSRNDSFSLRDVDLTRTVVADSGGTITSRTTSGTCTLVAVNDGVSLNFVWRSDGDVRLGIDGLPSDGNWSLLMPNNVVGLKVDQIGPLRLLRVSVDWFGNGSIDIPIFFVDFGDLH